MGGGRGGRRAGPAWEARPVPETPPAEARRWGGAHVPCGCWVAFGSAARRRAMAAQLVAVDAILRRPGASGRRGGDAGG
jgi:hypothetical protein